MAGGQESSGFCFLMHAEAEGILQVQCWPRWAEEARMLGRIAASESSLGRSRSRGAERRIDIGDQTILVGDCAAALALMPERSVDVIVTSPPYNIGLNYRSYDDTADRSDYLRWLKDIGLLLKRVLKDDGSFFLNIAGTSTDPWIAADAAD